MVGPVLSFGPAALRRGPIKNSDHSVNPVPVQGVIKGGSPKDDVQRKAADRAAQRAAQWPWPG